MKNLDQAIQIVKDRLEKVRYLSDTTLVSSEMRWLEELLLKLKAVKQTKQGK